MTTSRLTLSLAGFAIAAFTFPAAASAQDPPPADPSPNLLDAISLSDANIGGILFPHFHALGAFGHSSRDQSELALNAHDPQREATLQALEPGLSLRAGMLQGFANASGLTDAAGDFSFSLEEGFLKLVDLPLGIELRGGQFYNRFGFQNSVHNHGWIFVDQNLLNGRFLNEGELTTQGGEVSINLPLPKLQASVLSVAVGGLPSHGHGDEEHGAEAEFEAEGANFTDQLVTATWVNQYDINDMNRLTGIFSGAWGDNQFGRQSQVYGLGFEYLWRENGYAAGGQSLRWRTEAAFRHIDALSGHLPGEEEEEEAHEEEEDHHDEDHHGEDDHDDERRRAASFDEFGIYSMLVYGLNEHIETGVRAGWVSGIDSMGLDNRFRLSPMVTWYANPARTLQARLQYNWDHSEDFGDEHSVWFQLGLNFGGPEVR